MKIQNHSLKKARKSADIPLSTMASLLITDVSNLSKYERGIRKPPADIVLGYHLLTQASFTSLFSSHLRHAIMFMTERLDEVIQKLEAQLPTPKVEQLIIRLSERLTCIKAIDHTKDEHTE